jgi:hypothetical protein
MCGGAAVMSGHEKAMLRFRVSPSMNALLVRVNVSVPRALCFLK